MTDNTQAKKHLESQENILKDIEETNLISDSIKKHSLDLFTNLTNGKDLFVDNEVITSLNNIHNRLSTPPNNLLNDAHAKYIALKAEQAALEALLPIIPPPTPAQTNLRIAQHGAEVTEIKAKLKQLETITGPGGLGIGTKYTDRRNEYNNLSISANYFNTVDKINNIYVNLLVGPPRVGPEINQNLDILFKAPLAIAAGAAGNAYYTLCDDQGVALPQPTPGNYTVQIGGQTVTISGIDFTGRHLDMTNIKITPPNIDIPDTLKLSINGIYTVSSINVICNKKFDLQLKKGPVPVPVNTQVDRIPVVNNFNRRSPINTVTNEINNTYRNRFATFQRDSVFEALKHMDGARFTQLEEYGRKNGKEEEIKEELYQQIYRNFLTTPVIAGPLGTINNYGNFSNWYTEDARDWNNDKAVTGSAQLYEQYLHNNLSTRVEEYMKDELNRLLKNDHENNMCLKTELSTFLTSIEGRKNDEETNAAGQTIQTATEADIGEKDLMTKHGKKKFLGISWGRDDDIYTKFLNGANHEVKDQTVDIATNTSPEDFKNIEPVKYNLKTEITGKNNISTTITFPKTDKRYVRKEIILTQGEVSTLTKKILNCRDIGDFKVRTHIVYNMLVSMIKIAEKKNLSLRYRVSRTPNQRELVMDDKNIALYERDDTGAKRRINTLFDYNSFITTNTFHGTGDSRSLQTAIDGLMEHFNYAMNEYHKQYRNATTSRLLKTKVSANSFWTSPIKTVMNLRTVRKFDFTAKAASDDGKQNVDISFEKNIITLKMGDIELKGKDLGKLLEYRKNKIRVFDGIERNIIFAFYDELVKKLRENSKINRGNYCVRDPLTQNIYTMDEDGKLHIITPEDPGDILHGKNARIVSKTELDDVDARGGRRGCSEAETKEAFMNPCIMGRMIKVMNKKMLRM